MNYIKRLERENAALRLTLMEIYAELDELRGYLFSSKFEVDTTVQVQDILSRTAQAQYLATPPFDVDSPVTKHEMRLCGNRECTRQVPAEDAIFCEECELGRPLRLGDTVARLSAIRKGQVDYVGTVMATRPAVDDDGELYQVLSKEAGRTMTNTTFCPRRMLRFISRG